MSPKKTSMWLVPMTLLAFLAAGSGYAQGSENEAKAHFQAGVKLVGDGEYGKALEEFSAAFSLKPHWKIRFNIAVCHYELKNYADSATELTLFLEEGGKDVPKNQKKTAMDFLSDLKNKVGVLVLTGEIEDADVSIDGMKRKDIVQGEEIFLEAGTHKIAITFKGKTILDEEVDIKAGASRQIHAAVIDKEGSAGGGLKVTSQTTETAGKSSESELDTDSPEMIEAIRAMVMKEISEEQKTKTSTRIEKQKAAAWATIAVGGAALLVGSVLGGLVFSEKSTLDDIEKDFDGLGPAETERAERLQSQWDDHYDKAEKYAMTSNILLPLGGALALTGIVLIAVSVKQEKKMEAGSPVGLFLGPGTLTLSW
jgi:tetratricopeptide (TPR) repeat protein